MRRIQLHRQDTEVGIATPEGQTGNNFTKNTFLNFNRQCTLGERSGKKLCHTQSRGNKDVADHIKRCYKSCVFVIVTQRSEDIDDH